MRVDLRSFVSPHDVLHTVAEFPWTAGLPVGNGVLGGLVYQPEGRFEWSLNRLEVSQAMLYPMRGHDDAFSLQCDPQGEPITHQRVLEYLERGDWEGLDALYGHPFSYWDQDAENPAPFPPGFAPVACWLRLHPGDGPARGGCGTGQARLDLLRGRVVQTVPTPAGDARLTTWVSRDPAVFVLEVSGPGAAALAGTLEISRPSVPVALRDPVVTADTAQPSAFSVQAALAHNGFAWAVAGQVLPQAECLPGDTPGSLFLRAGGSDGAFTLLAAVRTVMDGPDPLALARQDVAAAVALGVAELGARHGAWWEAFWDRCVVETGDEFLDQLFYINLYSLASSNAAGSRLTEQAAGMSGLWQATDQLRWGNSWVLDVNIQETYSPSYATNHTELARPFEEGILYRVPEARALARDFFGIDGLAFSAAWYYAPYYHCSGPWYCLYLWMRYLYAPDDAYLRAIYPVLTETCAFYEQYLRDEEGRLVMWPSNCPENESHHMQVDSGWVMTTRNPALDLALLKRLLNDAAQAAGRLGVDPDRAARWRDMSARIADYHLVQSPSGTVIADSESELPPDEVELRHASRLMAIWPCGEFDLDSEPRWLEIARQTVRDTAPRAEVVPHTFGWIAAAAARLGMGDFARRHLLQRGVEPMLLPNGLFAEETTRGLQELNVDLPELPNQPLLEGGSSTVAALTEMLLQGHGHRIRLFPAMPTDCPGGRFWRLRTAGGFLVSAERRDGRVVWALMEATVSSPCVVVNPWGPEEEAVATTVQGVEIASGAEELSLPAEAGQTYLLHPRGAQPEPPDVLLGTSPAGPRVRRVHTGEGMHAWIGLDSDAVFWSAVEPFCGRFWNGNQRQSRHVPYRFQFGEVSRERTGELQQLLPARHRPHNMVEMSFRTVAPGSAYHPARAFGWTEHGELAVRRHTGPDALRREGLGGRDLAELRLDLPAGTYALMFILGDAETATWPVVSLDNGLAWSPQYALVGGSWATPVLPAHLESDGSLLVRFAACQALPWACCGLLVRRMN